MTVRSSGVLRPANGISNVVSGARPVESTSQTVRTNGHGTKTGVQYRRGKREGGEEPVSKDKHQIRSGKGTWAGRRGVGRLNPRRGIKVQRANQEVSEGKADL